MVHLCHRMWMFTNPEVIKVHLAISTSKCYPNVHRVFEITEMYPKCHEPKIKPFHGSHGAISRTTLPWNARRTNLSPGSLSRCYCHSGGFCLTKINKAEDQQWLIWIYLSYLTYLHCNVVEDRCRPVLVPSSWWLQVCMLKAWYTWHLGCQTSHPVGRHKQTFRCQTRHRWKEVSHQYWPYCIYRVAIRLYVCIYR